MATELDFANAVKGKLDGKAPIGHNHDDRYYTEAEADGRFVRTVNGTGPDGAGNVAVDAGSAVDDLDDVPDSATRLALTPAERTKLGNTTGTNTGDQTLPTWATIDGKPAVIAAGATQTEARDAIGAGTSNLALGTTSATAKAGDYQPSAANITDATATGRSVLTGTPKAGRDALDIAPSPTPAEMASMFEQPQNLFARADAYEGFVYLAGGTTPITSAINSISDFIPVEPGETYVFTGAARVTWFDKTKTYISDAGGLGAGSARPAPATAWYARVTFAKANLTTVQVSKGTVLPAYTVGQPVRLKPAHAPARPPIAPGETMFFDGSTNLFNPDTVTTGQVILASQGALSPNSQYAVSDWIAVEPAAQYTLTGAGLLRVTWYDVDFQYVGFHSFTAWPTTLTVPPRTRWARLSVPLTGLDSAQVNAGSSLLPYQRGGWKLKPTLALRDDPPFVLDSDIAGLWQAGTPVPDMPEIATSTVADVHTAWDGLVTANPTYITRTLIGNEGSTDALPIYSYRFTPTGVTNHVSNPLPKLIIVGATHGNEKAGTWSTFRMMERVCNDWKTDPVMGALRFNAEFIIVPVANPSGYRDNTRKNWNGVDPARNWPTRWWQGTPESPEYGGTAPLSENETIAMKTVLDANPDALAVIDFHNFHTPANDYYFLWGVAANKATADVCEANIRRMDRAWKASAPAVVNQSPDVFIGYVSAPPAGTLASEGNARGHRYAMTWEQSWKTPPQSTGTAYSSLAMTWGMESLVNLLTIMLRHQ